MRLLSLSLVVACVASAPIAHAQEPKSPDEKALYALGSRIAKDLKTLEITQEELKFFKAGMDDLYSGKTEIDPQDQATLQNIQRFQRERVQASLEKEKAASAAFLAEAAKQKGASKSDSGIVFILETAGEGASPGPSDTVQVTYKGTLRDGSVFDSQLDASKPAKFPLNGVIPCWQESIAKLKPGGKARFYCPSDVAYGDNGAPPSIRPGAALQFEVELLSVEAAAK